MKECTKVVVFVNGGMVTDVYSSDENVEVEVIDRDTTDKEEYELMEEATREANRLLEVGDLTVVY